MIPYDNIDPYDMQQYWGRGVVLFKCEDGWNAYKLTHCDHDEAYLELVDELPVTGEPDPELVMSVPEFYEKVMLHHPPLGAVEADNGGLYLLSWKHANGNDKAKAIREEDLLAEELEPPQNEEPEKPQNPLAGAKYSDAFAATMEAHRAEVMEETANELIPMRDLALARIAEYWHEFCTVDFNEPQLRADLGPRKVPLVLRYLNQSRTTLTEARQMDEKSRCLFGGPAWGLVQKTGVLLHNGPRLVGEVARETGELVVKPQDELEQLVADRLIRSLG